MKQKIIAISVFITLMLLSSIQTVNAQNEDSLQIIFISVENHIIINLHHLGFTHESINITDANFIVTGKGLGLRNFESKVTFSTSLSDSSWVWLRSDQIPFGLGVIKITFKGMVDDQVMQKSAGGIVIGPQVFIYNPSIF